MSPLSYNEEQQQRTELRHLFLPNWYGFVAEAIIGVVALIVFNLSQLNDQFLNKDTGTLANPLSLWGDWLDAFLTGIQQHVGVQQALLFVLWAIAGALIYILVFRALQLFVRAKHTIGEGVQLVQAQHAEGALRWFASLHDFFIKSLIIIAGAAALLIGTTICFGIASQELYYALTNSFPENLLPLLLSLVAAILGVRVVVIGISLLSRRFRAWYNS